MKYLKFAKYLSIGLLVMLGIGWAISPSERYVDVAEEVQDKSVMFEVPSVTTRIMFIFNNSNVEVKQATVAVTYIGSGVIIRDNGLVLSCAHVFDSPITGPIVAGLADGTTVQATLLGMDKARDLALLHIPGRYTPAKISTRRVRVGQEVIAVGNPFALTFTTTHGIVSYLKRNIEEEFLFTQTDAPINGGNSGGPLFNMQGELIGINARKYPNSDGLGLAIGLDTIRGYLAMFDLEG